MLEKFHILTKGEPGEDTASVRGRLHTPGLRLHAGPVREPRLPHPRHRLQVCPGEPGPHGQDQQDDAGGNGERAHLPGPHRPRESAEGTGSRDSLGGELVKLCRLEIVSV
jgi:hypothetical protein